MPKKYLLVNSADRTSSSSSSSDFQINLKPAIFGIKSIKLISAQLPTTFYNIRTGVNDRVCFNRSSTNYSAQIAAGNYTIAGLLSSIQTAMNALDANSYVCSYSSTTLKVTISGTSSFSLNWSSNPSASAGMYYELGWTAADTSSATSQTAPNVFDLSNPKYLYLWIPELPARDRIISTNATDKASFIIPISVNGGTIDAYTEASNFVQIKDQNGFILQSFTVQLYERNNRQITLNGIEWSFILELDIDND
jgi:hypothetical protein